MLRENSYNSLCNNDVVVLSDAIIINWNIKNNEFKDSVKLVLKDPVKLMFI